MQVLHHLFIVIKWLKKSIAFAMFASEPKNPERTLLDRKINQ